MGVKSVVGAAALALASSTVAASVVTPGNLVVLQVGDGSAALGTASAPLTLREITPSGSSVQSVAVPSGPSGITIVGTATSEGFLTFHDGHIAFGGYVAAPGLDPVNTAPSQTYPRRALGYNVAQDLSAGPVLSATTGYGSTVNMRSAIVNGSNFYVLAPRNPDDTASIFSPVYLPNGSDPTNGEDGVVIGSGIGASMRAMHIVNGDIYVSHRESSRGIDKIAGTPTTTDNVATFFLPTPAATNGGAAVNINDFWISDDLSTAYVADDGANGGVKKYVFNGDTSTYDHAYTLSTDYDGDGAVTSQARFLTVDFSGVNPVIYAVHEDGTRVVSLQDLGDKALSDPTLTTLLTADANTAFRGLAVVPEPGTGLLLAGGALLALRRRRSH